MYAASSSVQVCVCACARGERTLLPRMDVRPFLGRVGSRAHESQLRRPICVWRGAHPLTNRRIIKPDTEQTMLSRPGGLLETDVALWTGPYLRTDRMDYKYNTHEAGPF